jgi:tetratricopeptide (TPR) repeat protein
VAAQALSQAIADCNDSPEIERQIIGCSTYIESGRATGPNLVVALVNRAIALSAKRDYDKALVDFDRAIAIEPENWLARYNRANLYFDLGKDELAITDFTAAIGADPNTAIAYFNRGLAYERHGDIAEAMEDYRQAMTLDATDRRAKDRLDRLSPN